MNVHDLFKNLWRYIGAGEGRGATFRVIMLDGGDIYATGGLTWSYCGPAADFHSNFERVGPLP